MDAFTYSEIFDEVKQQNGSNKLLALGKLRVNTNDEEEHWLDESIQWLYKLYILKR